MHLEPEPITRPLLADEIAPLLRSVAGLPHWDRTLGEEVAVLARPSSAPIHRLDAAGWIAWTLGGLHVFAVPGQAANDPERGAPWIPSLQAAVDEARRTVIALALLRFRGNLTHTAVALGTSRRALRSHMKRLGLYPARRVLARIRERVAQRHVDVADAYAAMALATKGSGDVA